MSWLWFALRPEEPRDCSASAPAWTGDGSLAGHLCAWERSDEQPDGAAKIDARAVAGTGPAGWASLVVAGPNRTLPFDDVAVAGALRRVLALPPARAFSTLSLHDDRWLGSITCDDEVNRRLLDDPFDHLVRAMILRVDRGFIGHGPALPGPVIQRYGSDTPWPADRFAGAP